MSVVAILTCESFTGSFLRNLLIVGIFYGSNQTSELLNFFKFFQYMSLSNLLIVVHRVHGGRHFVNLLTRSMNASSIFLNEIILTLLTLNNERGRGGGGGASSFTSLLFDNLHYLFLHVKFLQRVLTPPHFSKKVIRAYAIQIYVP